MRKVLLSFELPPTARVTSSRFASQSETCLPLSQRQQGLDSKSFTGLKLVLAILLLVTAVGCGDPNRAKIIGTWNIDSPKAIDRVRQDPDSIEGESEMASDDVEQDQQRPKMIVHFYRSGALETETDMGRAISKKSGSWKLVSFDEAKQTLVIECDLTNQTTQHDILLDDVNTIRMVPPNMAGLKKKLKFVRQ